MFSDKLYYLAFLHGQKPLRFQPGPGKVYERLSPEDKEEVKKRVANDRHLRSDYLERLSYLNVHGCHNFWRMYEDCTRIADGGGRTSREGR